MHAKTVVAFALVAASALCATATPDLAKIGGLSKRQDFCQNPGFIPCYPAGSLSLNAPIASDNPMQFLHSMKSSGIASLSAKMVKRDVIAKRQQALCCNPSVHCLVLPDYNIPFCYNQSSTAYVFSDGSGGIVETGENFDAEGNVLNLFTGDYQLVNGTTGNIYVDKNVAPPDTSTLTIPKSTGTNSLASTTIGGSTVTTGSATTNTRATFSSTNSLASTTTTGSAATNTIATSSSPPNIADGAVPIAAAAGGALAAGIMAAGLLV